MDDEGGCSTAKIGVVIFSPVDDGGGDSGGRGCRWGAERSTGGSEPGEVKMRSIVRDGNGGVFVRGSGNGGERNAGEGWK